jgi:hypothetical protein
MDRSSCSHISWLEFVHSRAENHIICSRRLLRLANELPNAKVQAPSIALFLGKRAKNEALRQVLPHNNQTQGGKCNSTLNLRADPQSLNSPYPLYYADLDPTLQTCGLDVGGKTGCHEQQYYQVSWTVKSVGLCDVILSRLILSFTDVLCLFADDFGGLTQLRAFMVRWVATAAASRSQTCMRPHVLVVINEVEDPMQQLEVDLFNSDLDDEIDSSSVFASIKVVVSPLRYRSIRRRHLSFMQELSNSFDRARGDRMAQSLLFSAHHQEAIFRHALATVSRAAGDPLNFIGAARYGNEVRSDLVRHTENVLKISRRLPIATVVSVMASSIVMDAFPQGMHGK